VKGSLRTIRAHANRFVDPLRSAPRALDQRSRDISSCPQVPLGDGVLVGDDEPVEGKEEGRLETLTPLALLRTLHACGIKMAPYPEGKVRCHAPQGAWTPALLEALHTHQAAMAELLEAFEERAAIAEHCGGLSRDEAEQVARQCILGETSEQVLRTPVPVHRGDDDAACVALILAGWSTTLPVVWRCPAPALPV
jgi:hypothetical protein